MLVVPLSSPSTSHLICPPPLSQLFSRGGGGQDVIVVMVTDGCARFTSVAEHLQSNSSKHQDGYTWE